MLLQEHDNVVTVYLTEVKLLLLIMHTLQWTHPLQELNYTRLINIRHTNTRYVQCHSLP